MAFDFPSSPTNGQVFVPPSGPTYIFNGGVWNTVGGYGATFLQQQVITVSGDITLHSETLNFLVEVQGGGAGGGSNYGCAASQGSIGTGGGAGAYCSKWIKRPSGVYTPSCTVAASVGYSTNGNASTFTDGTNTLTAGGGYSGNVGAAYGSIVYGGGQGGIASGGDINAQGERGGAGLVWQLTGSVSILSGMGATSRFGVGGAQSLNTSGGAATLAGSPGIGYGSGGSGAASQGAGSGSVGGGAGTPGLVVITEFR